MAERILVAKLCMWFARFRCPPMAAMIVDAESRYRENIMFAGMKSW